MLKIWHKSAWDEYVAWQREDARTLKRINQADRIVFRISALTPDENALEILQCKGHYGWSICRRRFGRWQGSMRPD